MARLVAVVAALVGLSSSALAQDASDDPGVVVAPDAPSPSPDTPPDVDAPLPEPVPAVDPKKRADELSAWADQLRARNEHAAARQAYVQAYEFDPRPHLLLEIASTWRADSRFRQALVYYDRFLVVASASDWKRAEARRFADDLRRLLDVKTIAATGTAPLPTGAVEPSAPPTSVAPTPRADNSAHSDGRPYLIAGWSAVAVGGVALIGIGVSWSRLNHFEDKLAEQLQVTQANGASIFGCADPQTQSAEFSAINDTCDSGERWEKISGVFGVVTLAAAIAAPILLYKGYTARERSSVAIIPQLSPDHAGVEFAVSF